MLLRDHAHRRQQRRVLRSQRLGARDVEEIAGHDLDRRGSWLAFATARRDGLCQPDEAEEAARLRLFGALRPGGYGVAGIPQVRDHRREPAGGVQFAEQADVVAGTFRIDDVTQRIAPHELGATDHGDDPATSGIRGESLDDLRAQRTGSREHQPDSRGVNRTALRVVKRRGRLPPLRNVEPVRDVGLFRQRVNRGRCLRSLLVGRLHPVPLALERIRGE